MALPPRIRRLSTEDFATLEPPVRKGMEKLVEHLNPFLSESTGALEKRLTWDNFACVVKTVDLTVPEEWKDLAPINGWKTPGGREAAQVKKDRDGTVYLRGYVEGGSPGDPLFTLSKEYRPEHDQYLVTVQNGTPNVLQIKTSGDVNVSANLAYLTGVSFQGPFSTPDLALSVNCKGLPGRPAGVVVLRCEDLTGGISAAGIVPGIAWDIAQSRDTVGIVLREISGLSAGRKYRLTLLVTI